MVERITGSTLPSEAIGSPPVTTGLPPQDAHSRREFLRILGMSGAGIVLNRFGSARADDMPHAEDPGPIVAAGGGKLPTVIHDRFKQLASKNGRTHIIVMPSPPTDNEPQPDLTRGAGAFWGGWKEGEVTAELLYAGDRKEADSDEFLARFDGATGVWVGGGTQGEIMKRYLGTRTAGKLHELHRRGIPIGGTSAGAAVMSKVMIARGNPMAEIGEGFGFLKTKVVDQHVDTRDRMGRLFNVVTSRPENVELGIGVPERTAAFFHGNMISVVGESDVKICLPSHKNHNDVIIIKPGEERDLEALIREAIAAEAGMR